jgi:hypothetical protein
MLLELDDLPVHQAPTSLAHSMGGHPNAYDRFWFCGCREDLYFGVALGLYPNRGVVDAAMGTVRNGVQRSVFASGAIDGRATSVGPISIELVEPMRVTRVHVEAPEQGLRAALTFTARTAALEEPRQTRYDGARVFMDVTRATQLGTWTGSLEIDGEQIDVGEEPTYGTKDRSWGVRPVGDRIKAAPSTNAPQLFFLWAPLNFGDGGFHFTTFEDADGVAWSKTAASLDLLEPGASPVDVRGVHHATSVTHEVCFERGLRRAASAALRVELPGQPASSIELEPVLTFRMRGAGYMHPEYGHGVYHGGQIVAGEVHEVAELDTVSLHDVHVQQVVRATWGERRGIGVLEQLVIGPHAPSGLTDLLDGAP